MTRVRTSAVLQSVDQISLEEGESASVHTIQQSLLSASRGLHVQSNREQTDDGVWSARPEKDGGTKLCRILSHTPAAEEVHAHVARVALQRVHAHRVKLPVLSSSDKVGVAWQGRTGRLFI